MGAGIIDRLFPRTNVPQAPWCDHAQMGRQRSVGELEPDLVVSLSRASVGDSVGMLPECYVYLVFCLEGPCDGCSQQVFTLVQSSRSQEGKQVVFHELFPHVEKIQT